MQEILIDVRYSISRRLDSAVCLYRSCVRRHQRGPLAAGAADVVSTSSTSDPTTRRSPKSSSSSTTLARRRSTSPAGTSRAGSRTNPAETLLEPGTYLVIAEDPATLADRFLILDAVGPYEGRLSNTGERLVLRDTSGAVVDEVDYDISFRGPQHLPVVETRWNCSIRVLTTT